MNQKFIFFMVVMLIGLTACSGNKNEKLKREYRRFCIGYKLPTNKFTLESAIPSARISDFSGTGIHKMEFFFDETCLFAIIDVDPNYSIEQVLHSLGELNSSDVSNALTALLSDEKGQLLERIFKLD